jgi:hypothetical protein
MSIKLECRDGTVNIPKKYYEDYLSGDWYFGIIVRNNNYSNLDTENMTIEIWENKAAVLSLFDSLKFIKLTVHDGVSLDYLEKLADMWCAPTWLIDNIKRAQIVETKSKSITTDKLNILTHTFKCINCSAGYREIDNMETACHHHNRLFNPNSGTYNCCNRTSDEEPCITGFHVTQTYDYNLIYNMINKNEDE